MNNHTPRRIFICHYDLLLIIVLWYSYWVKWWPCDKKEEDCSNMDEWLLSTL